MMGMRLPAASFFVDTCSDLQKSAWALFLTKSSVSATFEEPGNYKLCKHLGGLSVALGFCRASALKTGPLFLCYNG